VSFEYPSNTPVVHTDSGKATDEWQIAFSRWHTIISTAQQSGVTADRPTTQVWIGRFYYDTTLGKPVWLHSVRPNVWHDASGAAV